MRLTDEQIATELRALRPTPRGDFAAELDYRAEHGFPRLEKDLPADRESPRRSFALRAAPISGGPLRWNRLLPALGAFAAVVVVIGIAVSLNGGNGTPDTGDLEAISGDQSQPGGAGAAAEQGPRETIAPASPTTVPPTRGEQLKPGRERLQERSASLALSTERGQVDDVSDGVVQVTDRYDGIVVSSNVNTSDGEGRANFDLRIPTQNLQGALSDLSDLAHVSSRNEGTLDITAPFVSAEERFADARAEVDSLLDQLADADSAAEVAAIREQLRLARQELATARSELGGLKQRADFSRLSVTVLGNGDGDDWSIGDAASDAVNVLEALAGATLITLAVLAPLAVIACVAWLGYAQLRRRRRESALDE